MSLGVALVLALRTETVFPSISTMRSCHGVRVLDRSQREAMGDVRPPEVDSGSWTLRATGASQDDRVRG
jgi:hypothetical protein